MAIRPFIASFFLFVLAVLAAPVFAQEDQAEGMPELTEDRNEWTVKFDPSIWLPAMRGNIGVGASPAFDVEAINLDEIEPTPAGRFSIRSDDLVIAFSGFGAGYNETETARGAFAVGGGAVAPGDSVDFDLDITSFELTVGHRLWSVPVGVNDPDPEKAIGSDVDVWLDLYAGARGYDIDSDFSGAVNASGEIEDIHAILGLALNMDLPEGFGMELSFDAGGGADGVSWDITVAFDYEITPNAAFVIGFRNLSTDIDGDGGAGDMEFDATLAGLFASLSIRF